VDCPVQQADLWPAICGGHSLHSYLVEHEVSDEVPSNKSLERMREREIAKPLLPQPRRSVQP
jgi:hypothetical protein